MKFRQLAIATTLALVAPALTTTALAARPVAGTQPAFQGQVRGSVGVTFQQRDRDNRADPRERELYNRYTSGRDSRWQFAFRDGYNEGLRDARAHRRYDPTVTSMYRTANHGYSRNWGSRDQFAVGYRNAFRDGYERGFYDITHRHTGLSLFFHWGR
jgi:flagellar biosynthesis/type III secretory pathway protein FliH